MKHLDRETFFDLALPRTTDLQSTREAPDHERMNQNVFPKQNQFD
jgi:hypothetical protein